MGTLLYILSLLLRTIILPIGIVYGLYASFKKSRIKNGFKYADAKMLIMAKSIDKYGNVVSKELFNDHLIVAGAAFPFGRIDQTISAVLGLNQRTGTLTTKGKKIVRILDSIDPNHCLKSIPKDL